MPSLQTIQTTSCSSESTYVSRKAATKGRAVLEGVGLLTGTIDACFTSHPQDEEGAVQTGLTRWSSGQGSQPPTWEVLISAMKYAEIAQQHIEVLRKELHPSLIGTLLHSMEVACVCVRVCVCVCVRACARACELHWGALCENCVGVGANECM